MRNSDEDKTTFYTNEGIYFYTKILFRLKNAGETYQALVYRVQKSDKSQPQKGGKEVYHLFHHLFLLILSNTRAS